MYEAASRRIRPPRELVSDGCEEERYRYPAGSQTRAPPLGTYTFIHLAVDVSLGAVYFFI